LHVNFFGAAESWNQFGSLMPNPKGAHESANLSLSAPPVTLHIYFVGRNGTTAQRATEQLVDMSDMRVAGEGTKGNPKRCWGENSNDEGHQWKPNSNQGGGIVKTWKNSDGMREVISVPRKIADGRVLVHNRIQPQSLFGLNGFRVWTQRLSDTIEICDCKFAGVDLRGLVHYRVKRPLEIK